METNDFCTALRSRAGFICVDSVLISLFRTEAQKTTVYPLSQARAGYHPIGMRRIRSSTGPCSGGREEKSDSFRL